LNAAAEVKNEGKPLKGEWDFQLQELWDAASAGDDVLVEVVDIEVDDNGRIYLFDRKYNTFFAFGPEGKFLYSFGKQGEGPGEYKMVFNFFLEGKYVIAPDMGRFHYFAADGKFAKTYNPGVMVFPTAFIDENRFITVLKRGDEKEEVEKLQVLDLSTMKRTTIAEIEAEKALTASGSTGGGTMVLKIKDPNTTPMIVAAVNNNGIYYGKNDKYLVKKTDLTGKELLSFSLQGRALKKIPMAFKRKRIENFRLNGKKLPKDMADQIIKGIPDYCTFFNKITIDESGLIYVFVNDMANETGQEIDIFSPQGKYLYHSFVKLPGGLPWKSPFEIKGNHLYIFTEDEEGEFKLVKFSIKKPGLE